MLGATVIDSDLVSRKIADDRLGLFQSDHDYDMISNANAEAGLHKLEEDTVAKAKASGDADAEEHFYYSMYEPSHPAVVREYLDSGILVELLKKKKVKMLEPPSQWDFLSDPCYAYVLVSACAMSLGCTLPSDDLILLKKVYTEGGLMPGALKQMHKALYGPDGYNNGVAYDFKSKDLLETASSARDESISCSRGFIPLNVIGPGGFFNTGMGNSTTSPIIKELRAQYAMPDACGGCGITAEKSAEPLMRCAKCAHRMYCGKVCQKKHWKIHKKVCDPAIKLMD